MPILYDFGYLSNKSKRILKELIALGVPVVDVRRSPRSKRHEWSQKSLQQEPGIIYYWIEDLGNDLYREAHTGQPGEPHIHLHNSDAGIATLKDIVEQHGKAAIMCACRDRKQCHCVEVGRLAVAAIPGLHISHL